MKIIRKMTLYIFGIVLFYILDMYVLDSSNVKLWYESFAKSITIMYGIFFVLQKTINKKLYLICSPILMLIILLCKVLKYGFTLNSLFFACIVTICVVLLVFGINKLDEIIQRNRYSK